MSKSNSSSNSDSSHPSSGVAHVSEELNCENEPAFGWTPYTELVNGRVAMLAILGLVLLEWFTKQDLWTWLGLR